jgi:trigger factor
MADTQNIKHTLEITVPAAEVDRETEQVIASIQKKVRLPGFRPGKVPLGVIRSRYAEDIRHDVIEKLLPKYFFKRAEEESLNVVGTPNVSDVHLTAGEPLRFKASFEVSPSIELQEYKDLTVPYQDPEVGEEDVDKRLAEIREQKSEYVNVDPRPVAQDDHALVSLESLSGVTGPPIKQEEVTLHVGGEDTVAGFSENLLGMSPGEEKEFEVVYPQDYGQEKLAGKTIRFRARLKGIRRKELPEFNDEFARDLGDYRNMEELRGAIHASIFGERQYLAQQEARNKLVEVLVDLHDFPVPEAYIERQLEFQIERQVQMLAEQGIDASKLKLDWEKLKNSQRDKAAREVKGSLLLGKIADAEGIFATNEEVDREVHRIAKQDREPVAAVRIRLEKEGVLPRIASRIRTDKTLTFLFEHARKVAQAEPAA